MDDKNTPETEEDDFPGLNEIYSHSIDIDDLHVDCIFPPPSINASMATVDSRGVEHRGKGSSKGGQFVQKGMGESDKDLPSDKGRSQNEINKNFNDKPSDNLPRTRKDVVNNENLPGTNKEGPITSNKLNTSSKPDPAEYNSDSISEEDLETISALHQFYPPEYHDLLQSLAFGEVTDVSPLKEKGINASELLFLSDGSKGVYKDIRGEEGFLRDGIKKNTYYKREIAASLVAHVLGFGDLVPITTYRKTKDSFGSIQHFKENSASGIDNYKDTFGEDNEKLARAAIYDYIIGNTDRNIGNWLVPESNVFTEETEFDYVKKYNHPTDQKTANITLIDHGLAFPYKHSPYDFTNIAILEMASEKKLPLPDTSYMKTFWPKVEQILRTSGVEDTAINLTKQRFDSVTSGKFKSINKLPVFAKPEKEVKTIEDFSIFLDRIEKEHENRINQLAAKNLAANQAKEKKVEFEKNQDQPTRKE